MLNGADANPVVTFVVEKFIRNTIYKEVTENSDTSSKKLKLDSEKNDEFTTLSKNLKVSRKSLTRSTSYSTITSNVIPHSSLSLYT